MAVIVVAMVVVAVVVIDVDHVVGVAVQWQRQ